MVARAGFEPAKLYAEDLESTPFDRSGTSPMFHLCSTSFLTILYLETIFPIFLFIVMALFYAAEMINLIVSLKLK